ncbi:hypothetical protein O181_037904 [Austropuccinia psidii MF-1]|uniref:Amino acid transporter transmembrane domain-containing protein n=1 Tax=Austropuccinia psidii MF-1 TaxID=1389203 RepID=A0A9Q3HD27_9BASI|nr:hypothetical protein [Austropuccinia psidii MF-1]
MAQVNHQQSNHIDQSNHLKLKEIQPKIQPIYTPRLASTIASREFAYEADSDTVSDLENSINQPASSKNLNINSSSSSLSTINPEIDSDHQRSSLTINDHHPSIYLSNDDSNVPLLSSNQDRSLKPFDEPPSPSESSDYHHLLNSGGGIIASIANMANSILGAGIIGLPYALKNAGFVTGTGMIIILGIVTDWSIRLIALNSKLTGQKTYIGILEQCFGLPGKAVISFFQFIFAFGGMCAFGVIVGDSIPPVLSTMFPFVAKSNWFSFLFSRTFVIAFFTIMVSYPLSLYRDISKLSKASALALVSMVIIVFAVAFGGPSVDSSLKGSDAARWTWIQPGIIEAIGVISFAFVCHHNSLLIYGALRTPTLDRFSQVTHASTAISVIACLAMSFSGFLAFTDRTQANVLNNFPQNDIIINFARLCFGLNMFTTLPLECFVCRETLETFFHQDEPYNRTRHIFYTTLLVGSGLLISLLTCDLGIVLELTGGLAASALAYVFPAACQLKLSTKSIYERENWPGLLTILFGLIVMVISTVSTLFKSLDSTRPAKVCH